MPLRVWQHASPGPTAPGIIRPVSCAVAHEVGFPAGLLSHLVRRRGGLVRPKTSMKLLQWCKVILYD